MKNLIWISTMALGCMALLPACNGASIEGAWVEPVRVWKICSRVLFLSPMEQLLL